MWTNWKENKLNNDIDNLAHINQQKKKNNIQRKLLLNTIIITIEIV